MRPDVRGCVQGPRGCALDQHQILADALLLGYAQQVLTGLIDKRALNLLNFVPGKDPAQDRLLSHSMPAS